MMFMVEFVRSSFMSISCSAMQSSERGRKINNALSKTTVAFSNARSAMSSWFTSLAQEWKEEDATDEEADNTDVSKTL